MARIFIATNLELVNREYAATVEAEYGDFCVEGTKATLAHHGSRSNNPAPCCWGEKLPELENGDEILVSHIDLDTIGGCLDLLGIKPNCPEFWEAAAFVDVNGPHHIHELSKHQQNMLNAYYAWNQAQPRVRYTEVTDVTDVILTHRAILERIVALEPELIAAGKQWEEETTAATESKLHSESPLVRAFVTDGVFCSASYYSPTLKAVIPATVCLNTATRAITIAFADGGKTCSAREIVQRLWGPEAGGRDGIAGSPRGWNVTDEELKANFEKAVLEVAAAL